jgi:purine-binding chemotaxis protein CheW
MNAVHSILVFQLEATRCALRLETVERAVRLVEVVPLPRAPNVVMGIINVQGTVVPVMNIRRRFRLPERSLCLSDHLILARTPRRKVALIADAVLGVEMCREEDWVEADSIVPGVEHVAGVVKREDGLVLIHDLNTFLSLEEDRVLEAALHQEAGT